jgi:hypothetical protein
MSDYVANGPISVPLYLTGVRADVDLGGLKFSYQVGMFYTPEVDVIPVTLPPPFEEGRA